MNKLSILIFSLVVVVSALSVASATDLDAAWNEYENSRNLMQTSFAELDESWVVVDAARASGLDGVLEANNSWDLIQNSWAEIDAARAIVANTLDIHLFDSSPRGSRPTPQGFGLRSITRDTVSTLPLSPPARTLVGVDAPAGSYAALDQSWVILGQAWDAIDAGWENLNRAWISVNNRNEFLTALWTASDAEWVKINAAWAELDAAWASKQY